MPRMFASRLASSWRVDSGKSIATKNRLPMAVPR
jgi:hypothetical protein